MSKKIFLLTLIVLISFSLSADQHWDYVSGTSGPIENTNGGRVEASALYIQGGWIDSDPSLAALTIRGPNSGTTARLRLQTYGKIQLGVHDGAGAFPYALEIKNDKHIFVATDLDVGGTTTTGILTITGGSDLAEPFHISAAEKLGAIEPGMVASIDMENPGQLRISSKPYDRTVVGVISGAGGINPGMIMQQNDNAFANGEHPIALTGRVFVQADTSNGAIQPGDLLTTSSTPGHVMRVTDHAKAVGAIIGKAMTGLDSESGLVLMVVALQ